MVTGAKAATRLWSRVRDLSTRKVYMAILNKLYEVTILKDIAVAPRSMFGLVPT